MSSFLSLVLWFICLYHMANGLLELTLFPPNTKGAQCLDGSPAGFYYQSPQYGHSDLWVIYLDGGGACHTKNSCTSRANSSLGSSTFWSKTSNKDFNGVMSSDPSLNPDFYRGHHVNVPYCNGDVWSGQRSEPSINPDTWGFYFSGHLVFASVIEYLANHLDFLNAAQVLLTGGSAGGMGTFVNIDFLSSEAQRHGLNKSVMIKAAPLAGWFFASNTSDQLTDPLMPPNDYPHWIAHEDGGEGHDDSINILYDSYFNPTCVNALSKTNNSWHCGSVGNLFEYIETPIFVMENKYDTNQLEAQFLLPKNTVNNDTTGYVEYFGGDMDRSILSAYSGQTKNGLFYASCFTHGGGIGIGNDYKPTTIDGYNSSELVGDWFWERNKLPHIVYDKCNSNDNQLPCNPTCPGYPPNNN